VTIFDAPEVAKFGEFLWADSLEWYFYDLIVYLIDLHTVDTSVLRRGDEMLILTSLSLMQGELDGNGYCGFECTVIIDGPKSIHQFCLVIKVAW